VSSGGTHIFATHLRNGIVALGEEEPTATLLQTWNVQSIDRAPSTTGITTTPAVLGISIEGGLQPPTVDPCR
jgi:hypothetical protein